jgi:hypothetical protein
MKIMGKGNRSCVVIASRGIQDLRLPHQMTVPSKLSISNRKFVEVLSILNLKVTQFLLADEFRCLP